MSVRYDITANDAQFSATMQRVRNNLRDTSATAQREGGMIEKYMSNIATAAGGIFSAMAVKQFVSQAAQIRGTFQQLEIAFSTMLQSEEKATALMKDVTEFAAKTPFDLQGVASGVKQLLAFGSASEEVIDEMRMLGDIAAGLSIPIGDLVYLYGTTRTQGRMFTMDLRQFMGRGIPLAEELAKQFGVTKDQVGQLVTDGKVGFEEMRKALVAMTSEGGKFGGMMDESSKSISGQISNLEDSIDQMFNKIGESMEGAISGTLNVATKLVENYDKIGRALVELIALYGAYRVALVFARQAALGYSAAETLLYGKLLLAEKAQKMLNLTMLKNPYVLAGAALAGLVIGIGRLISANKEANIQAEATEHHAEMLNARAEAQQKENEILEKHLSVLEDDNSSRNAQLDAMSYLVNKYPELMEKYKAEILDLQQIANLRNEINGIQVQSNYDEDEARFKRLQKIKELNDNWDIKKHGAFGAYLSENGVSNKDFMQYFGFSRNKGTKIVNAEYELAYQQYMSNQLEQWKGGLHKMTDEQIKTQLDEWERLSSAIKNGEKSLSDVEKSFLTKGIDALVATQNVRLQNQMKDDAKAVEEAAKAKEEALKKTAKVEENLRKKLADAEYDNALANTKDEEDKLELQSARRIQLLQEEYEEQKKLFEMAGLDTTELEQSYARLIELEAQKLGLEKEELNTKNKNVLAEKYQKEIEAMRESLKEFGDIEAKKYAIRKEYEDKIKNAESQSEKSLLEKQRDREIGNLQSQQIKQNIDWTVVFGEFGSMFSNVTKPVLDDLKKYIETDAFKNSDADVQQSIVQAIQQLESTIGGGGVKVGFEKLGKDISTTADKLKKLNEATAKQEERTKALEKAEEGYLKVKDSLNETERKEAQDRLNYAQSEVDKGSAEVKQAEADYIESQGEVSQTATTLKVSLDGVISSLQQLSSGSLPSIYNGLISLGDNLSKLENAGKLGDAFGKLSEKMKNVPILEWIVAIIDIFKDGISVVVEGIIDAVFDAITGIIEDVLSGDLIVSIGESLVKGIGKLLDVLTFGLFSSIGAIGVSDKDYEEDSKLLIASNEALRDSIDALSEQMEKMSNQDATEAYKRMIEMINKSISNQQELIERGAANYSNGFLGIGGSRSSNAFIEEALADGIIRGEDGFALNLEESFKRLSEITGVTIDEVKDLWKLTPEQMQKIKDEAPDLWAAIKKGGAEGETDISQMLEDYVARAGEAEEATKRWQEQLTSISFDSLESEFSSMLNNLEMDADEAGENIGETMIKAIISQMMNSKYRAKLEQWYSDFAAYMEDGTLTEEEAAKLREAYAAITEEAFKERDALLDAVGLDENGITQGSSGGSFDTITQQQAHILDGRFTDIQIKMNSVIERLGHFSGMYNEMISIHLLNQQYLFRISENTKPIQRIATEISEIRKKTDLL